jgi:hypothetical protein
VDGGRHDGPAGQRNRGARAPDLGSAHVAVGAGDHRTRNWQASELSRPASAPLLLHGFCITLPVRLWLREA